MRRPTFYLPSYDPADPSLGLGKVIWETEIEFQIRLYKNRNHFAVQYGKQVNSHLSYEEATTCLGEAMLHGLTLQGKTT